MKWFKMDCDAQENLDMRKLIEDWGWDWYGRYFAIVGKIGMLVTEKRQSFTLQTNDGCPFPVKLLSKDLGTTVGRLTNFCDYLANNHLIDKAAWVSQRIIYMPKLQERADEYTRKLIATANKLPTISRHSPDQEVEEDNKKREKKKELNDPDLLPKKVLDDFFEELWKLYPKRDGRKDALRHFTATVKTADDVSNLRKAINNYCEYIRISKVEDRFVKQGSTFFNNWQDWVNPSPQMIGKGNGNGSPANRQGSSNCGGVKPATGKYENVGTKVHL